MYDFLDTMIGLPGLSSLQTQTEEQGHPKQCAGQYHIVFVALTNSYVTADTIDVSWSNS